SVDWTVYQIEAVLPLAPQPLKERQKLFRPSLVPSYPASSFPARQATNSTPSRLPPQRIAIQDSDSARQSPMFRNFTASTIHANPPRVLPLQMGVCKRANKLLPSKDRHETSETAFQ